MKVVGVPSKFNCLELEKGENIFPKSKGMWGENLGAFAEFMGSPSRSGLNFRRNVRAFNAEVWLDTPTQQKAVAKGDKIILASSLLNELHSAMEALAESGQPLIFEVTAGHPPNQRRTHVGVLEFSGTEPGAAFFPKWVLDTLGIATDGTPVALRLRSLPSMNSLRLRPLDPTFNASVQDPKATLEEALRSHTAMTEGDHLKITMPDGKRTFTFLVLQVGPASDLKAASLVDANLEVQFDDYLDRKSVV